MAIERIALLALVFALVTTGCSLKPGRTQINWDLSHSHTRADVSWPPGASQYRIDDADVTIRLAAERVFTAQQVQLTLWSVQEPDAIGVLAIAFPKVTFEDAYQHATELAQEWGLSTVALEPWRAQVMANRQQGKADTVLHPFPVLGGPPLSPDGPTPYLKILDSFDQQQPYILDFEFQWVSVQ